MTQRSADWSLLHGMCKVNTVSGAVRQQVAVFTVVLLLQ
jgi:hypothetical protein